MSCEIRINFVSLFARSSRSLRQKWRSSRGEIQKLIFRKFYLVSHVDWMLKYATVAFIFCLRALAVSEERANLFSILGFGNLTSSQAESLQMQFRSSYYDIYFTAHPRCPYAAPTRRGAWVRVGAF